MSIKQVLEKYWKSARCSARYVGGPFREVTCLASEDMYNELKEATKDWPMPGWCEPGMRIVRTHCDNKGHKDFGKAIFVFDAVQDDIPEVQPDF